MKMFENVAKVGVFCDAIKHHNETRTSGEVKVITLTLRVDPFNHQLAQSLADVVRHTLFKLNHPDPQPHLRRCDFALGIERQQLHVFASSDTPKASILFDQVKVGRIYARTKKDANGYTLVFDATFGPVGKTELAYAEAWRGTQRAVTFEAAEPDLEFQTADEDDDEEEKPATKPTPMFDDPRDEPQSARAAAEQPEAARHTPRRHPRQQKPH